MKIHLTKEQEKIYFDSMKFRHQCNWYQQIYGVKHTDYLTCADILHWWYVYHALTIVEHIGVGEGKVYYPEPTVIATYKPNRDLGMPIFNFVDKYVDLNYMQRIYIRGLIEERNNGKK